MSCLQLEPWVFLHSQCCYVQSASLSLSLRMRVRLRWSAHQRADAAHACGLKQPGPVVAINLLTSASCSCVAPGAACLLSGPGPYRHRSTCVSGKRRACLRSCPPSPREAQCIHTHKQHNPRKRTHTHTHTQSTGGTMHGYRYLWQTDSRAFKKP